MLEESVGMERKGTPRQTSTPGKSNTTLERKDTGSTNKNFNRHNKKRESTGGVRVPQPENANRRPFTQKNRLPLDKRPRSRGSYGYRQREEVVEAENNEAKESKAYQKFPRGGNASHLLNFQYVSRNSEVGTVRRPYGRPRRNFRVTYNKERYLQANCQFVVNNTGDYTKQSVDPDALVDWGLVEQVRTYSHEVACCPICLQEPSAGKITKCGHVYCWSCILHYLSLDDKSWCKCPICFESIHKADLRSVKVLAKQEYKVGDTITLQLMKRERDSTYSVPIVHWEERRGKPQNVSDEVNTEFAKVLVATSDQILSTVIDRERDELTVQMAEADPSEVCFIESAQVYLCEREAALQGAAQCSHSPVGNEGCLGVASGGSNKTSAANRDVVEVCFPTPRYPQLAYKGNKHAHKEYADAFDELELDVDHDGSEEESHFSDTEKLSDGDDFDSIDSLPSSPLANSLPAAFLEEGTAGDGLAAESFQPENVFSMVPPSRIDDATMTSEEAIENLALPDTSVDENPKRNRNISKKDFYFYQASDGQQIYLHSINARCIDHQYGGLKNGPRTITGKIIDKEVAFMTENIRGRTRYLSHLPLTCEFQVLELDLRPPLISEQTLKEFAGALQERANRRQRLKREDKRQARKERIREQLYYGFYPKLKVPLDSPHHFPPPEVDERRQLPSVSDTPSGSSPPSATPVVSELDARAAEFVPRVPREEQIQPTFSFAAAVKQQPVARPAWGPGSTTTLQEPQPHMPPHRCDTDSDNEDRVAVPDYHDSFNDSFAAAMDAALAKDITATERKGKGGKKKKKEAKLLFSTSMMRR